MNACSRRQVLGALGAAATAAALRTPLAKAQSTSPGGTLGFNSATELAQMIREKKLSSVELTRYFIGRIERFDAALNAVVVRDFERALAAAAAADQALARGDVAGALHGLPMTIKEQFDVAGLTTTWGIPARKGNIAAKDSDYAARLKAAGAHILGKSNVPAELADWQSYNEIYGRTNNPWNLERTPGGSSGGTAAALAAGMTALDAGGDITGSIRVPASFCGVYGHKPTWGIVSDRGALGPGVLAVADLAVVGPLARSADDLELSLDVVAGLGALDSPGLRVALPPARATSLAGLRVALWPNHDIAPVSMEIADRIQAIGDRLAAAGAKVSDSARPAFDPADCLRLFLNLVASLTGAYFPDDQYEASRALAQKIDPADTSSGAIAARATALDHRAWIASHEARIRLRETWATFFEDWDIVLCPPTQTTAFPHDRRPEAERTLRVDGVERSYRQQMFWSTLATVPYLPSTVFPTGPSVDGLPIGVQAIGAAYADRTTIGFARLIANEIGGFRPPPGYAD